MTLSVLSHLDQTARIYLKLIADSPLDRPTPAIIHGPAVLGLGRPSARLAGPTKQAIEVSAAASRLATGDSAETSRASGGSAEGHGGLAKRHQAADGIEIDVLHRFLCSQPLLMVIPVPSPDISARRLCSTHMRSVSRTYRSRRSRKSIASCDTRC